MTAQPAYSVYRANGFAVFRLCSRHGDRKLVVQYSIEPYERKPDFSLPFGKYCSNLRIVIEKKLCFGLKESLGIIILCSDLLKTGQGRETPSLPYTSMHFALPTSGLNLPCAVPNFTGIPVVIAQPAYSVDLYWVCGLCYHDDYSREKRHRAWQIATGSW